MIQNYEVTYFCLCEHLELFIEIKMITQGRGKGCKIEKIQR